MTTLTDAQFAVFERLTERTFLVLDTEYCKDPDGGLPRLVSLGLTPIVRGKRAFDGELYVEMNPGVPIDAATTAIHGFTDADVARKRRFAHYAPAILRALADDDAVLVVHTGADVGVLRGELERLDGAGDEAIGIDDLPDLPIVDTSTLPRLLRHPVAGTRPSVSLRALCDATGVANRSAHNAKSDARATADALIQLLVHAAASTTYGDINALLVDHDRGTTRAPRLALHIVGRGASPRGSAQHLARHVAPLTHAGSEAELRAWVELAASCVQVRCEHLRTEARLAAAENGPVLLRRLVELLPAAAEPGQAGTLVGAITALLEAGRRHADPPATEPAMTRTMAMHWWRALRTGIESSAPCAGKRRCPDCWEGNGCPRDTLYKPVARVLTFGDDDSLSRDHIRRELIGPSPKRRINSWRQTQPRIAAHMVWLVAMWCDTEGISHSPYTKRAAELDLHAHDPHLALLLCRERSESGAVSAAQTIASEALRSTTSDPAYDDLQAWATWQEQTLELASRRSVNRTITHPRLARPDGRVNANPYVPKG